jgi:hypothetical protein
MDDIAARLLHLGKVEEPIGAARQIAGLLERDRLLPERITLGLGRERPSTHRAVDPWCLGLALAHLASIASRLADVPAPLILGDDGCTGPPFDTTVAEAESRHARRAAAMLEVRSAGRQLARPRDAGQQGRRDVGPAQPGAKLPALPARAGRKAGRRRRGLGRPRPRRAPPAASTPPPRPPRRHRPDRPPARGLGAHLPLKLRGSPADREPRQGSSFLRP